MNAEESKNIKLVSPTKKGGLTIQETFAKRKSTRDGIDTKMLSKQHLSDLLWSAIGVSRDDGKRTAPSARDTRDIDVYVALQDAVYMYDPKKHELIWIADGDYRKDVVSGQEFVLDYPIVLFMVADFSRYEPIPSPVGHDFSNIAPVFAAIDSGIISQNINLFCAGNGFVTVTRAMMNHEILVKGLKLNENQKIFLNNPVGYSK
jgi:hypothetical protein